MAEPSPADSAAPPPTQPPPPAQQPQQQSRSFVRPWPAAAALSAILHIGLFWFLLRLPSPQATPKPRPLVGEMRVPPPPKPIEPPPAVEAPPTPPPPKPKKPPLVRRKVAAVPREAPKQTAPVPPDAPAPNQTPPEQPPDAPPAVPVFGLSLSSVTQVGGGPGFSVGNTLDQGASRAGKGDAPPAPLPYVPAYAVTTLPKRRGDCTAAYPPKARRLGLEGQVILDVTVLETGRVGEVKVVKTLNPELDEAAVAALKKCAFDPARLNNEAVATRIQYTYTFVLED